MSSTTIVHHGHPDDYGLDAVARHNAQASTEFPEFPEDVKGLGIYVSRTLKSNDERVLTHHPAA
jgi:hypothetical protein